MTAADLGRPHVIVVGSINVDLTVRVRELPARGETVAGGTFESSGGGKGANQAVAAARAGARVMLVGGLGDDRFAADALAELAAEKVDTHAVRRLCDQSTGIALIVVDERGDNQIAVASGANHALQDDMVTAALTNVDLERGCLLTTFELSNEAVIAGGRAARDAGCQLIVNPAPARPLPPALVTLQPILTPNEHEACDLARVPDPRQAAAALHAQTGAPVVVTIGSRGALVADAGKVIPVDAPPTDAVDATGAGDTFNGVLASELARGTALLTAAEIAVTAATLSVTRAGARTGMPSRAQIAERRGTSREPSW